MIVGNVLLVSNSEKTDQTDEQKVSDDEMNEHEQQEYQLKLQNRKKKMTRLNSQLSTIENKDLLLPGRDQKANSLKVLKELMTPDVRKNHRNKLKSVLEVEEVGNSSNESSDDEMMAGQGQLIVKTF
jgi:hypothetical protein